MPANNYVIYFVVAMFILLFILFVIFLYDQNQSNTIDPNIFRYVRIQHIKSESYLVLRSFPRTQTSSVSDSTTPNYYPVLAIGGASNDALGLWQLQGNTSVTPPKFQIQNGYTGRWITPESTFFPDNGAIQIGCSGTTAGMSVYLQRGQDQYWSPRNNKTGVPPGITGAFFICPLDKNIGMVYNSTFNLIQTGGGLGDSFILRPPVVQ